MKLTDLHIEEFGSLHRLSLPSLPTGFSGLYGPNGSGKTTLMYFLRGAMGDKSDAIAASLWQTTERHCGSVGVQRGIGRPSEAVTIRGGLKTKRELLGDDSKNTAAAARLATLVASEAVDAKSLLNLANKLGLDAVSETRDRDAERRYETTRETLSDRLRTLSRSIADGRTRKASLQDRLRRERADWENAVARLDTQLHDVAAAVRSADRVTERRHADYQAAQSDRHEWETDAWRPRRVKTIARTVPAAPAMQPRPTSDAGTVETALSEIARLRCQASARRIRGYAAEHDFCDRCDDETRVIRERIESIRGRIARTDDVRSLDADLADLTTLLDRCDESFDWLRADRAIALLDRCERDLLRVRGSLGESVCGAEPRVASPRSTEVIETVAAEPAADAELGRYLLERRDELRARWQTAMKNGCQARRHLAQIRAERAALIAPDLDALEREIDKVAAKIAAEEHNQSSTQAELAALVKPDSRGPNPILEAASGYFRRMTCDHYRGLTLKDRKKELPRLVAITRGQHVVDARTLSRGTAGQAALALRLALLDAIAEQGQRWPLLLDDALVDSDHERMAAGVGVLKDWAADRGGRQVVVLTCQRQLVEAMHNQSVPLRTLPGGQHVLDEIRGIRTAVRTEPTIERPAPKPAAATPPIQFVETTPLAPTRETVSTSKTEKTELKTEQKTKTAPAATIEVVTFDADQVQTVEAPEAAGPERYWLTLDTELIDVPSIDRQTARRLSTLNLLSVDDLVLADSVDLEARLIRLQINPEHFRRWQAEADLLATVPELSARDAQILAYIGIADAGELAAIEWSELKRLIEAGRERSLRNGATTRFDWDGLSSQRTRGWIARAQRGRRSASRRSHVRGSSRTTASRSSSRRSTSSRSTNAGSREGLSVMERRRKDRQQAEPKTHEWKHYLHKSSPVVDAPSIGPKMAKRLGKLGIVTVADLLGCKPGRVAKQLDDRRIDEQTVTDWVDQSRLMCRIPQLRGHDAQVLVACGYRSLGSLEGQSAAKVFAKVGPFVATKEGQRLLRSSRTPDLDEVTDWLNWVGHARSLKAA